MSTNHVGKGVVLLVEGEDGTIGGACMQLSDYIGAGMWVWRGKHTSIGSLSNLLLAISEQKELESIQIVSLLLVFFGAPVYISMCHSSVTLRDALYDALMLIEGRARSTYLSGAFISTSSRASLLRFL